MGNHKRMDFYNKGTYEEPINMQFNMLRGESHFIKNF